MAIITIQRPARCSDCVFLKKVRIGKMKRHRCNNPESKYYKSQITLKDLVCKKWLLF